MSILSDASLKAAIKGNRLILGGDAEKVKYCAYQFTAEKIFVPGEEGPIHDWSAPKPDAHHVIIPGAMVWIRTAGIVEMPADMCAFYWQTNKLSQSGLMLANSSMVEPGYKGPLACLFVNFGKQPVVINPRTPLAKLIFMQLDQPAAEPLRWSPDPVEYDQNVKNVAVSAPRTFLQVGDLSSTLKAEKTAAIDEIKAAAAQSRKDEVAAFEKDINSRLWKVFGLAGVGLLLVLALMNWFSWIQAQIRPSMEREIQARIEAELRPHFLGKIGESVAQRDSLILSLETRLRTLQTTVDSLSKRPPSP